jgi:threonine/homoserine/homoserine lactone efflux protein
MTDPTIGWSYLIPGITLGFAAAVQPGPLTIYLISRTLRAGWKRTFPAIFAPLISDGPIALLCLFILGSLPTGFLQYIQIAGGLFILYLAFEAARTWRKGNDSIRIERVSSGRTLFDATVVNFLNPGPYLGWSLVIGPLFLKGWKAAPFNGILLLSGFYLTMFIFTTLVIFLFDKTRERGPKLQRILLGLSAVFLACFGIYQLVAGAMALAG